MNDELLKEAQDLAELLFTEAEIRTILNTHVSDLKTAVLKGHLVTEAEVRRMVISQAKAGSAEAQKIVNVWLQNLRHARR